MRDKRRIALLIVLLLLGGAVLAGIWGTGAPNQPAAASQRRASGPRTRAVDQRALQTALQLEKLATTREEIWLQRDAFHLADHELDLAFASALRDARQHPAGETPEIKALADRVRECESRVKDDQERIRKLTSALAGGRGSKAKELQDQLQLAQAELVLHQSDLAGARHGLVRAGGDPESRIQRMFKQHQEAYHKESAQPAAPPTRGETFQVPGNALGQLRLWQALRKKGQQLAEAQQQATTAAAGLVSKRDELDKHVQQLSQSATVAQPSLKNSTAGAQRTASLAALEHLADDRKTLSEYDERIQDEQQLAQVYGDWSNLAAGRRQACVHGLLQCVFWILLIVAVVILGNSLVERTSSRLMADRRRIATTRLLGRFVVQAAGVLLILVILLGSPGQLSTILALAGAGLTVALKDFIVAFLGWFILMGKNGIRVGDWVEINGIGGEVVQVGLLRTVLLETGSWGDSGHPTGRRVTFANSFAIEGHYFNFSTTGQWLWDALEILVPAGQDVYALTDAILHLVTKETEANVHMAEQEWQRATKDYGTQAFSAVPVLSVRPTLQGINIIVRYITRANERYATQARLYQAVVELLQRRNIPAPLVERAVAGSDT